MSANISCQIAHSDYNGKQSNKHVLSHRSSKVDVFINTDSIPTIPKEPTIGKESDQTVPISAHITHGDVDNFDHILQVTSHQEAVYAYYYMDENNKVRNRNQSLCFNVNCIFWRMYTIFTNLFNLLLGQSN